MDIQQFDELNLTRRQIDCMLHQDMRVATKLQNVEQDKQQFYSIEQTKNDHDLINQALQNAGKLKMTDQEKYRLRVIQGRNISHLLLNQDQYSTDSPEMKLVKDDVAALEQLLGSAWDEEHALDSIIELESAYQIAIASCKNYCSSKSPSFRSGKERKQMVEETLQHLQAEAELIHAARSMAEWGELPKNMESKSELLEAAARNAGGQHQEQKAAGVTALTYADFASMLGTHNRGQIIFSGNGLQMINNGVFSSEDNTISDENFELREQLYVVSLKKMGEQATPEFAMHLERVLGLNVEVQKSKPLSRRELYEVITEVNLHSSQVAQTLQAGEQAPWSRRVIAKEVTRKIGGSLGDWDVTYTPNQVGEEMKKQINDMLKAAKNRGIQVPNLSKHQMDVLVRGNLPLLRDQLFESLNMMYDMRCRLNGGNDEDIKEVVGNEAVVSQMLVYEISKITTENADDRKLIEHEQKAYMTGMAFAMGVRENLAEDFEQSRVGDLAVGGSEGLELAVEQRLPECEAWRQDRSRMKRGYDGLVSLCDRMQTLTQLQESALYEGLTDEQRTKMLQLSTQIQNMLALQPDGSANPLADDMEFVAKELKGSRFAEGFATAKARVREQGFSFELAAGNITALVRPVQREMKKRNGSASRRKISEMAQMAKELGSGLGTGAKQILDVLLLQKSASDLVKAVKTGKENAAGELMGLYRILRQFSAGEPQVERVNIAGTNVQLMQSQTGVLSVRLERRTIMLPFTAAMLAERMETDIMTNESLYDREEVAAILRRQRPDSENGGDMVRVRNLCLKLLQSKTGKPAAFFNNISDRRLKDYALYLAEGVTTAEDVISDVNKMENPVLINGEEALALLRKSKELREEEMHVELTHHEPVEEEQGPAWSENETKVKNLLSDLFFSTQTWELDENERSTMAKLHEAEKSGDNAQIVQLRKTQSAERMRRVILNHMDALYYVMKDPGLLDGMLDKLPLPGSGDGEQADMKQQIKESVHQMLAMPQLEQLKKVANGRFESLAKIGFRVAVGAALYHPDAMEQLAELDTQINQAVEQSMNSIQQMINDSVSTLFSRAGQNAQGANPVRREAYGNTPEEIQRWKTDSSAELRRMLQQAASGERGQGLFTKNVFQNYFQGVSRMDQRAMLASALRGAKPYGEPAPDASKEEVQAHRKKVMGNYLGGVLKGAGPLLQKMLQGMPIDAMPEELKSALKDMRSNLAPIPEEFVRVQLRSMIERSQGKVTDIKVERALGAASVGQAFLCKFKGPDLPEEGQDVVVKLLRPNVRNHMMREKNIMIQCAKMTDHPDGIGMEEIGGMEATYRGQLMRIEEELDLTIEAQNVERGRIYDEGVQTVQAMKVNPLVEPTVNAMALEKASGTTLDKYMEQVRTEYRAEIGSLYLEKEEDLVKLEMTKPVHLRKGGDFCKTYTKLTKMYEQLYKRQKYLTELADKWVTEGVFGRGFYHGDLHAGNIMVDDQKMTIIDFGNATKLDETQQKHVVKMMLAAGYGMMGDFRHSFHMLLQNTPEEKYQEKREALGKMIEEVFQMGTTKDTGARIAVVLLKAQELGLELPPAIANFSQSQIRLQQTIEEMNTMMETLQREITRLKEAHIHGGSQGDWLSLMLMTGNRYAMRKEAERDMPQDIDHDEFIDAVRVAIRAAKTEDELGKFFEKTNLDRIETEGTKDAIQSLREQLHDMWRKRDDPNVSDEERARAEHAFHENYMKSYVVYAREQMSFYKSVAGIIEAPRAEYFLEELMDDTAYKGKELREAYETFTIACELQLPDREEKRTAFASLFLQIESHRMFEFKKTMEKAPRLDMDKPGTFFGVMSDVINTNKKAAVDRLGLLYTLKVYFNQHGDDK